MSIYGKRKNDAVKIVSDLRLAMCSLDAKLKELTDEIDKLSEKEYFYGGRKNASAKRLSMELSMLLIKFRGANK